MNSRKKSILFAGMILAAASTFGAYAQSAGSESRQTENFENQVTAGTGLNNYTPSEHPGVSTTASPKTESAQEEAFENQLSAGTVSSYTASEHSGTNR
jgi:hypothetical protein